MALRVFVPPPLEWNHRTMTARSALSQTPYDLARINSGLVFGMTPEQVAAQLPGMPPDLAWNTLRTAREYSADVRYFWVRLDDLPEWRKRLGGCIGNASYVAFLFSQHGLFRVSFRLLPDAACASVTDAALDLFARYVDHRTGHCTERALPLHAGRGRGCNRPDRDPIGAGALAHERIIMRSILAAVLAAAVLNPSISRAGPAGYDMDLATPPVIRDAQAPIACTVTFLIQDIATGDLFAQRIRIPPIELRSGRRRPPAMPPRPAAAPAEFRP